MNRRDGLADIGRHLPHKLSAAVNECDITLFRVKNGLIRLFLYADPAKRHIKRHKCDQYDKNDKQHKMTFIPTLLSEVFVVCPENVNLIID